MGMLGTVQTGHDIPMGGVRGSGHKVEVESSVDHPYFVYGQGWASCRPEQTMVTYGLKCHLLQVGDVCISLSPRPPGSDRKRRWSAPDQLPDPEQPADLHKPRTQAASP
ncbi:unnamed protein product [Nezara viridula]|uniref:AXH domain-containing protein n=1 Tax=Nezara viridula TaxID=85310 RepID=A0A9P0MQ65_NEZVI|nr:unnamed protein product [Nezara viridula]